MNRKLVPGLILAAPLLYLDLTWGFGRMALSQLEGWREYTAAEYAVPFLKVADRTVRSGLFSSTEDVTYEFSLDAFRELTDADEADLHPASDTAEPEPLRFTLRNHIHHGPLPGFSGFGMARVDTSVVLDEETRQMLMANIGTDKPLEMTTTLGFLGGGVSRLTSPAFQYVHAEDNTTFEWRGMDSRFDFGRNMGSLKGVATIAGVRVSEAPDGETTGGALELGEMRLDADLKRAIGKIFAGKGSMTLAGFTFTKDGTSPPVTAKDARYDFDMAMVDDYLDVIAKFGLGQLTIEKADVTDMHYDVALRHLHAQTCADMHERLQALQTQGLMAGPAANMAMMGLLAEYGPKLLEHTPELAVDHIGFTLPEGSLKLSGKVSLPGFTMADLQTGMTSLLAKLDATLDIRISEGLLEKDWSGVTRPDAGTDAPDAGLSNLQKFKAQTEAFEQQGFITRNGDVLESRIEFRNGAMTVNGKPMGPPASPAM